MEMEKGRVGAGVGRGMGSEPLNGRRFSLGDDGNVLDVDSGDMSVKVVSATELDTQK